MAAIHSLYTAADLSDPAHPPLLHTHTLTQWREISLHRQFLSLSSSSPSIFKPWDDHECSGATMTKLGPGVSQGNIRMS